MYEFGLQVSMLKVMLETTLIYDGLGAWTLQKNCVVFICELVSAQNLSLSTN